MNDQSFDKFIKESLQDYRKADTPGDWGSFAERVAREVDSDPADLFDEAVRDRLTHYEAPFNASHWDQFAHRLDASLHDQYAEELDQHVHLSLKDYQVPYAPDTWPVLEKKLVAHRRYVRRLYFTKAMEVAALVLFLFTFYRFWPVYHELIQKGEPQGPIASIPMPEPVTPTSGNESSGATRLQAENPTFAQADVRTSSTGLPPANSTEFLDASHPASSPSKAPAATTGNFHSIEEAEIHSLIKTHEPELANVAPAPTPPPVLSQRTQEVPLSIEESRRAPGIMDIAFNALPVNFTEAASHENAIHLSAYQKESRQHVPKRLSMFGTMDINHALLSAFKLNDKVAFNEKEVTNLGHGAGISILFDYGKVELETGIQYNNIQNNPNTQVKVGTPTIGIEDFDYYLIDWDVIKLPLNALYKLKDEGRFQYYASFGVDLSIIAQATYHYSAPAISAFRVTDPNDDAGRNSKLTVSRDIAQMQTSLLDKGKKDAYFNVHIGAGFEYLLTDRHRLFFETAYQQPLVTPSVINEKDRFKIISSKLGARMEF